MCFIASQSSKEGANLFAAVRTRLQSQRVGLCGMVVWSPFTVCTAVMQVFTRGLVARQTVRGEDRNNFAQCEAPGPKLLWSTPAGSLHRQSRVQRHTSHRAPYRKSHALYPSHQSLPGPVTHHSFLTSRAGCRIRPEPPSHLPSLPFARWANYR